jgi:hypothetical protein
LRLDQTDLHAITPALQICRKWQLQASCYSVAAAPGAGRESGCAWCHLISSDHLFLEIDDTDPKSEVSVRGSIGLPSQGSQKGLSGPELIALQLTRQ